MADEPEAVTHWHRWPGEWVRDKSWWREVSSRAMAGLIVALIVALVGLLLAWGFSDTFRPTVVSLLVALPIIAVGGVLVTLLGRRNTLLTMSRERRGSLWWWVGAVTSFSIIIVGMLYVILLAKLLGALAGLAATPVP